MAVKVSCGLQKKIGQPDYGSLGASCQVEFEIDVSLIESISMRFIKRSGTLSQLAKRQSNNNSTSIV